MRDGSLMGPVLLENGIEYTDSYTVMGSSSTTSNNDTPKNGEEVIILAKLFYNGLQVNKGLPNEVIPFTCVQDKDDVKSHTFLRTSFSPLFVDVPLEGLTSALVGLNYGVRRKATLPGKYRSISNLVLPILLSHLLSISSLTPTRCITFLMTLHLSANLAFGSKGFAPYIPPGAAVMYEITVSPKNDQPKGPDTKSRSSSSAREDSTEMEKDQRIVDTTIV